MHPSQTLHGVDDSETVGTLKLGKNRSDGEVYVTEHVYTLLVTDEICIDCDFTPKSKLEL